MQLRPCQMSHFFRTLLAAHTFTLGEHVLNWARGAGNDSSSGVELLYDPKLRRQMGIESNDQPTSAVVELNLLYPEGLSAACLLPRVPGRICSSKASLAWSTSASTVTAR